jgi:hypothetical protein
VGDQRVARAGGLGPVVRRVGHHGDAAARFEKVVDRLGHPLSVGPVERLSEGDDRSQFHGQDSGTAPDVKESSRAIQPALRSQRGSDCSGVWRAASEVVRGAPL